MYLTGVTGDVKLQATLAAASPGTDSPRPHHPITCQGDLEFDEVGFRCEHAEVPAGDARTQACVDQSVAILLFEVLAERERAR